MNQRDKEEIFRDLYKRKLKHVIGYCYSHLSSYHSNPEDMAQEIFMQAYNALDTFRGESKIDTWLFKVAKNYCLNRYRYLSSTKRYGKHVYIDKNDWAIMIKDKSLDPLNAAVYADFLDRVMVCIHSLKPIQRDVLIAIMNNDSYEAAAKELGLPINSFRSRLSRARVVAAQKMVRKGVKEKS